jgi:hypothetical protein
MLTEAFSLILQLPPLAFGPALPPGAFVIPQSLVCDIHALGRIQQPQSQLSVALRTSLDPRNLKPAQDRPLLNPALEFVMVMGALASTRGGWDDRTWATKRWEATGAVTPVLVPPQAPPIWNVGR